MAIVISGVVMNNTRDFKSIGNISNISTTFPDRVINSIKLSFEKRIFNSGVNSTIKRF